MRALVVLISGIAAGVVATWIMNRVTTLMYERERKAARQREDAARGEKTAYEIAADKAAAIIGRTLTDRQRAQWGQVIHWSLGIGAAIVYTAIRTQLESPGLRHGLLFGFIFWAVMDETVTPLLRLTPGPLAFPWQTHLRGLVGHLVFGGVTELTLTLLGMVD
jgi:uncharacterized membrane protein YagU involved in acid resistance